MTDLNKLERESVQDHAPRGAINYNWFGIPDLKKPNDILPPWGAHGRDRALRLLYRNPYSWLAQAAVTALTRKVAQTPTIVQGDVEVASYYNEIFQNADFGKGWDIFLGKVLLDFLTADYGAYIEIIGAGASDTPLRGPVLGIAHLDTLRCVPTNSLEYPVVYWSRLTGKMHKLHHTRVHRLVDMIDGDELWHEPGLCALSRAASILELQNEMQKYATNTMKEMPAAGILFVSGATQDQWDLAYDSFKVRQTQGYKGFMSVAADGALPVSGELVQFSAAPEGFDLGDYTEIAVNAIATAFGIDRQDLWPLTGRQAGTATQSAVLDHKAQGQGYGYILQSLERFINRKVLPAGTTFEFQFSDIEGDSERTARDNAIVQTALQMRGLVSDDVLIRYIASQSEAWRDVLTNEAGELVELPDDQQSDPDAQTPDQATTQQADDDNAARSALQPETGERAIAATRLQFEDRFTDILNEAIDGNLNRARLRTLVRGLIQQRGTAAFSDALEEYGITELSDEDRARITSLIADQNQYLNAFLDAALNGTITHEQAENHAEMWFNKSIMPFYQAGTLSANRNGLFEWVVGNTDHCRDCLRLNGQIHRYRDWVRKGWLPRSSNLECKGFHCACNLVTTTERARGRW